MNNIPADSYQSIVKQTTTKIIKLKKQLLLYSLVRLLFFLLALVSPFIFYNISLWGTIVVFIVLMGFFVWAVKKHISLASEKEFYQHILQINNDELKAIDHKFLQIHQSRSFLYLRPRYFWSWFVISISEPNRNPTRTSAVGENAFRAIK